MNGVVSMNYEADLRIPFDTRVVEPEVAIRGAWRMPNSVCLSTVWQWKSVSRSTTMTCTYCTAGIGCGVNSGNW